MVWRALSTFSKRKTIRAGCFGAGYCSRASRIDRFTCDGLEFARERNILRSRRQPAESVLDEAKQGKPARKKPIASNPGGRPTNYGFDEQASFPIEIAGQLAYPFRK